MNSRSQSLVRASEIGAAAVAAILSPVPLADEVVLFPALVGLGATVGRARGVPFRALPWRVLAETAATALAARAIVNLAVSWVPGVAAVANAMSAFALTGVYARWADVACADPERATTPSYEQLIAAVRTSMPRRRARAS